uniref:Spermatogenesis associated 2 like n=1 Tax=Astyanax mexicanus TaxID=7994 RepID=A0A3B1JGH6_ASTMX
MSAAVRARNKGGLLELYEASLQQRIQQGNWNLVCRDEALYKEVEGLLAKGPAHDIHSSLGLDPLSVMEASLQALPNTSRQTGLERLAKAFEVLELAALNLYMCPWRKEYRVVKMFSGMFTHYVKPALTLQQAEELFRLLGYQPADTTEEEELRLSSKPVHADSLLQLACAFFTARMECQLLGTVVPLGSGVKWELQLIRERKLGHSLQVALESAKRKLQLAPQSSEHDTSAELDLYTDDHQDPGEWPKTNHMTAPPNSHYTPPKGTPLSLRATTQSKKENDENTSKTQPVCVSKMTCQISPPQKTELSPKPLKTENDNEKQVPTLTGGAQVKVSKVDPQMCRCFESYDNYAYYCVQCKQIHNLECQWLNRCSEQGHDLRKVQQHGMDVQPQPTQNWEKAPKGNLKMHSCMQSSTSDVFLVCHNCQNIHDFQCDGLRYCQLVEHTLQKTGKVQPPQEERDGAAPPRRHTCLRAEDQPHIVCHTCEKVHDCLCKEVERCRESGHSMGYLEVVSKEEVRTPSRPITFHECCTSEPPIFVCFTCRVFHSISCDMLCSGKHEMERLKAFCAVCSYHKIHTLCKYCCAQYCKKCWFKNPLECKCGMPFEHSAV